MAPPLLTLDDIHLTFGSTALLEGAALAIHSGERLCLVGRNGSGKSTLLKIAAGIVESDAGERFLKPGTTVRYLPQEPDLTEYPTIEAYVRAGLEGADQDYRIPYLLDALGLSGEESTAHLSGGEARRAALVRTLAPEPDILMLDEPTNHLDLPAIEWLEGELSRMNSAIVLISHDRRFLETLSRRTVWMDRGETKSLEKGFAHFEDWRDEIIAQEELDRHKLDRKIHREQHWVVHGVSGRRKRNVRRLKELGSLRQQVKEQRKVTGDVSFTTVEAAKSGKAVARLEHVNMSFGERPIITDFSMRVGRGERIGIVGPNGSGKTTLLKLIMGEIEPDSGVIVRGTNLEPLIIDQKRESLDPDWTLAEAMTDGRGDNVIIGDSAVHVMRYMKDFLFLPEQARTPLHALSGGERGRLQLARGLRLPSNFLVLDEPTNDLDLETLDLLQELVSDYAGTVILVSHDRDFIDRIVTRTIAYEGPGQWQVYAGGYSDLIDQRGRGVGKRKSETDGSRNSSNAAKAETAKPKAKLSYKHRFRLEQIPGEMEKTEKRIAAAVKRLTDPDLFKSQPDEFAKIADKLQALKDHLDKLETEWLKLEALKDASE